MRPVSPGSGAFDRERRVVDDAPSTAGRLDDTLHVLVLCAHPALTAPSQVALMLRAVCGLSTSQIAAGFHVPEATMARRLSRARSTIDERDRAVPPPSAADLVIRISAVRHALALMFNEGYTASGGPQLVDADLAAEAIRITRHLQAALPHDTETMGLLALMLLSHSRAAARVDGRGELVPLPDQERQRWDRELIAEGVELVERALPAGPVGPFQLQAAIAAVHAEAATAAATDWAQIVELYRLLDRRAPSPVVTLNMAVAVGMAEGASSGLSLLAPLLDDPAQRHNHRLAAAQAHLLELAGDTAAAREAFARAASMTTSIPEQRYLNRRAAS